MRHIEFKFVPFDHVHISALDTSGRVVRSCLNGGPQPIYLVHYFMNGEGRSFEFYEDELKKLDF